MYLLNRESMILQ